MALHRDLGEPERQRDGGRLARAQASLAELKAARMRGKLLDAAEVERTWGGILRTIRAGLLAVPSRVGARLPHLDATDVAEIDGWRRREPCGGRCGASASQAW